MLNKFLLILVVLLVTTSSTTTITIVVFTTITNSEYALSATAQQDTIIEDPQQFSAQITKARDDIRNELMEQGQIITNAIEEQFGFENVQANLTQAYQTSFTGDAGSAVTQLKSADSALESSIISLLRSGQELVSVSQNKSVILDSNTRLILKDFGESLSNMSIATDDIRSQLQQTS